MDLSLEPQDWVGERDREGKVGEGQKRFELKPPPPSSRTQRP